MSDKQQEAIGLITQGKNVFVSGVAGTGKSYVINQIRNEPGTIVVAPTGIAALNVQGVTAHKMFGLPLGMATFNDFNTTKGSIKDIHHNIKRIICDEGGMLRADYLDLIDWKLKALRNNDKPFGGIQVCLFGDLLQLEPIVGQREKQYFYEDYDSPYITSSEAFEGFETVILDKVYRQENQRHANLLNSVRMKDKWSKLAIKKITEESKPYVIDDKNLTLCCYNADADEINQKHYNKINGSQVTYLAYSDNLTKWEKDAVVPSTLKLKVGTRVLICANGEGYVNGQRGVVEFLGKDYVSVNIDGVGVVDVVKNTWEKHKYSKNDKNLEKQLESYYKQFPLRLGWAISVHKCMPGYTKIDTNKGVKSLKDIKVGDIVHTGKSYRKVLNKWDSGYKENFTLSTKQGFSVDSSEDHKFLVSTDGKLPEYIPLKDIKVGDHVCVDISRKHYSNEPLPELKYTPRSKKLTKEIVNDEYFSYIVGLLIGDGNYSVKKDGRIELTNGDNEVIQYFKGYMEDKGLNTTVRKGTNCEGCYIHSIAVRNMLEDIGLNYVTARHKSVPEILMNSHYKNRRYLLSGLIDTDGCVSKGKIRYVTVSERLAKQVRDLWLSLGIYAYISVQDGDKYTVNVSGAEAFKAKDVLSLKSPRKRDNLKDFKKTFKTNCDSIPFSDIVSKECSKILQEEGYVLTKEVARGLWKCSGHKGRMYLLDLINKYKGTEDLFSEYLNEDIMYAEVTDIKSNGVEKMYDIEVEEHHSFTANNIIVHNCQGMTLDNVALDIGRGCFSAGQLYVSLSRVKDLKNLSLVRPIRHKDIIVRREAVEFYKNV